MFRCAFRGCQAAAMAEAFVDHPVTTEKGWTIACAEHKAVLEAVGVECVPLGADALAALELHGAARVGEAWANRGWNPPKKGD